jgi:hypothetical protein
VAGRGPLPKDPSLRRHRGGDGLARRQVMLPAGGRVGDPPVWPLEGKREGELDVWRRLWATPQAAAWEGCGFDHELAMLARLVAAADQPYLNVRQMTALYA